MKSICVISSTRADYGILSPLLWRIQSDTALELRLAVTGTHLSPDFGMTIHEIELDALPVDARIPILATGDGPDAVSKTMANALNGFAAYFANRKPDIVLALGDRYEIFAICAAAVNARIPIAHLHGGETTEGAVDECFRHAISKMSYLHFTSCEDYRRRVIQLGEAPERVFNVGALGVENALHTDFLSLSELERTMGFDISSKPCVVVTFHPVTLEEDTAQAQLGELLKALSLLRNFRFLITKANADVGGKAINAALDAFSQDHSHCQVVTSLGMRKYMSVLKHAAFVMGNSSSGILEAPSFGIPTINIGNRQRGRMQAESVINCAPICADILDAVDQACSPAFRELAARTENPYGDGDTSARIIEILPPFLKKINIDLKKEFYDIRLGGA